MNELEEKIVALLNDAIMPLEAKYYLISNIELKLENLILEQKVKELNQNKEENNGVQ